MPADLHRHRLGVLRALMARMELINASIGHNLTQGEENEEAIRDLLTSVLPQEYGIGSGVIVGVDGEPSKQMDIVVYDRTRANLSLGANSRLFFADQVLLAIEVKTTFTSGDNSSLFSALENIASLKRLKVAPHEWVETRVDEGGGFSIVRYKPSPPLGMVFFFSTPETAGPLDLDSFFRTLKAAIDNVPLAEQPDLLLSLGHASYFKHKDVGAHAEATQEYAAVLVQDASDGNSVLQLPEDVGPLKALLDVSQMDLTAGEIMGVQVSNPAKTSTIHVIRGDVLREEPTVYRVARAKKSYWLLDRVRAFLLCVEVIEILLRVKRPSPRWSGNDYFGPTWSATKAYPRDFQSS